MTKDPKTKTTLIGWLGYSEIPEWTRARLFGGLIGASLALLITWFGIIALASIWRMAVVVFTHDPNTPLDLRGLSFFVAASIGLPFIVWRSYTAHREAQTAEEGLITDRINKAVEQLGREKTTRRIYKNDDGNPHLDAQNVPITQEITEPNLEVRLGALYALERIAQDSIRDHIQIMEIICAYIRENTREPRIDLDASEAVGTTRYLPPRADIQTALTILGRRSQARLDHESNALESPYRLDLRNSNLQRADLADSRLGPVLFDHADLQAAGLRKANLQRARLVGANLQGATLVAANLEEAKFWYTNLRESDLASAKLQSAVLWNCSFAQASLGSADFQNATNLTQEQLNLSYGKAHGIGQTRLPVGLTPPAHWYDAPDATDDALLEFSMAYFEWCEANPLP